MKFPSKSSLMLAIVSMLLGLGNVGAVDGELDGTFADGGKLKFAFDFAPPHDEFAYNILVNGDLSYVIGYVSTSSGQPPAIIRLTRDGSTDDSYDSDGIRIVDDLYSIYDSYDFRAAALQSDGKMVVAGSATLGANTDMLACRFLPDGKLDDDFGNELGCRRVKFDLTPNGFESADAMVIKPNGRILLTGKAYAPGGTERLAIAQLNSLGAVDESFGEGDGRVDQGYPPWKRAYAESILLDRQGRILVGGNIAELVSHPCYQDMFVMRFDPHGVLDPTYGTMGRSLIQFDLGQTSADCPAWKDWFADMSLDAQGALYVGGGAEFTSTGDDRAVAVAKLTPAGVLDDSFGIFGKITHYVCDVCTNSGSFSFMRRPDSKMLMAGHTSAGTIHPQTFVMRLSKNGEFERSTYVGFDTSPDYDNSIDSVLAIASQHGRTVMVGGSAPAGSIKHDMTAARIDDDYIFFNDLE